MKHLLTDARLLSLTNEIEAHLGPIGIGEMEPAHREIAMCSMSYDNGNWSLLIDPTREIDQALICHELAHLILIIEGWPALSIATSIPERTPHYEVLSMLKNLMLHIDVWDIVKKMGFNEIPAYYPELLNLCDDIENSRMKHSAYPELQTPIRAAFIAQALLGPCPDETRARIIESAKITMPEALDSATRAISAIKSHCPLDRKKCLQGLVDLMNELEILPTFYTLHEFEVLDEGFRKKFI